MSATGRVASLEFDQLLLSLSTKSRFPYPDRDPKKYAEWMEMLYTVVYEGDAGDVPLGYMPQPVFEKLAQVPVGIRGEMDWDPSRRTVRILQGQPTEKDRTQTIAALAAHWRSTKAFVLLKSWRDEAWPVFGSNGALLFSMEWMAVGLFGAMRYGVHMTAYTVSPESSHGIKIWVPTRAANKSSYPGMLDNTVAGGLMTGEDPFECMIRESDEEASLPEEIVRAHCKLTGAITYIYITDERAGGEPGYIYPECQWIYDLQLPADVIPTPKDGEVESFSLRTVDEIQELLSEGRFKPNCALIMLDFFIRHGILTRENEPNYDEIVERSHRLMPFPGPHQKYQQQGSTS